MRLKSKPLYKKVLPGLLRRLGHIGIKIEPFITVREGESPVEAMPTSDDYEFRFLTASEIADLLKLEPHTDRNKEIARFQNDKLCFGVWDGTRLIAKMWCDLGEYNYPPNFRSLAENEAYLYAAYTDPDYRGQSIAPRMRTAAYASLSKLGRTTFLSYSDLFNTPSRRFKAKLGAREEALRLHVGLFGRWSKTVTLRTYG